jgi:hypothetical protein
MIWDVYELSEGDDVRLDSNMLRVTSGPNSSWPSARMNVPFETNRYTVQVDFQPLTTIEDGLPAPDDN